MVGMNLQGSSRGSPVTISRKHCRIHVSDIQPTSLRFTADGLCLWPRTDAHMPDMSNAGRSIPVLNFTREVSKKLMIIDSASKNRKFTIFRLQLENSDYEMNI
jgi:hypothetical protein